MADGNFVFAYLTTYPSICDVPEKYENNTKNLLIMRESST
jgi:hypothetical protein